eukprot:156501_1
MASPVHFAVFIFGTSLVFGYNGPWGSKMRPDFFDLNPNGDTWPYILYDEMDFSWLYRYSEEIPFLYQLNVLQYHENEQYFYHKLDAALDIEKQAVSGQTLDGINPDTDAGKALIDEITGGNIYRQISRDGLRYTLVRIKTETYGQSIVKKEWDSFTTIRSGTNTYFSGFEAVDGALFTNHALYGTLLRAKYSQQQTTAFVEQITDFHRYDLTVDWIAYGWKDPHFTTRFVPVPYTTPMAQKHRELTRHLVNNAKVTQAVQKVMTAVWQNVNAVKGKVIGGVTASTRPLANAARDNAFREREVAKTFNAWNARRRDNALNRGMTWKVVPGSPIPNYANFEAIATGGILREQMLLINAYGYKECDSFWDAFVAYMNRDSTNPFDAAKSAHDWAFYSQWFNAEDMERRNRFFKAKHRDFDDKRTDYRTRECKEIRWQKYGGSQKCQEQERAFRDSGLGSKTFGVPKDSRIKVDRLPRNKDIHPRLTDREKAFFIQEAGTTKNFAKERIYTKQNQQEWTRVGLLNARSDMIIPWFTGYEEFLPNYRLACFYELLYWKFPGHEDHDVLGVATVSKSSDLLMDIAYSFGLRGEELFYFELGVIAYMAVAPSHSITEVLRGFPYKEAGSHLEEEYTLKKDPYAFIENQMQLHKMEALAMFEDFGDDLGQEVSVEDEQFRVPYDESAYTQRGGFNGYNDNVSRGVLIEMVLPLVVLLMSVCSVCIVAHVCVGAGCFVYGNVWPMIHKKVDDEIASMGDRL